MSFLYAGYENLSNKPRASPRRRDAKPPGSSCHVPLYPIHGGGGNRLAAEKQRPRAHWLWLWKFRVVDTRAHIDPDKYGWPCILAANSWVIPTAFAIVALKQFAACHQSEHANQRIRVGTGTLLDRVCLRDGWNARNRRCLWRVPLMPHVEATLTAGHQSCFAWLLGGFSGKW